MAPFDKVRQATLEARLAPGSEESSDAAEDGAESIAEGESFSEGSPAVDYTGAARVELLFLCRMKCIAKQKNMIETGSFRWNQAKDFNAMVNVLMKLWSELTFDDVSIASRGNGKHFGKLFEMLTLRVPQVYVDVDLPVELGYGSEKKVGYKLMRRLPKDSLFYTSFEGPMKFFVYTKEDIGNGIDLEKMWRRHIDEATAASALSYKHWPTTVDVDIIGVNLLHQHDRADLLLMSQLAKFKPDTRCATAAHGFMYMCWKKQRPFYLISVLCTFASIIALVDITFCTKVLSCQDAQAGHWCCPDPAVQRRPTTLVVLGMSVWLLLTDAMYAFTLIRETNHPSIVFARTRGFVILLEATTAVIAAQMAWHGWTFAASHYIRYFMVVSCRWLHLLYILLPVPVVGKTVLPMYKAVFSHESTAFIVVNLVILTGAFQAYISLRSDINATNHPNLVQPILDSLLQQYRLSFLGDFSLNEMRGEDLQLNSEDGVITLLPGEADQRRGVAVFMIVVTFLQAVLMLNLYIGILGEAYSRHKQKVDAEFMHFRAHFMLKSLCLVHFTNKYLGFGCLNSCLARFDSFAKADCLWVVRPRDKEEAADDASPDPFEGDILQPPCDEEDSPRLMQRLSSRLCVHSRTRSFSLLDDDDDGD